MDGKYVVDSYRKSPQECITCKLPNYRLVDTRYNKGICMPCFTVCIFCHNEVGVCNENLPICRKCCSLYMKEILMLYKPLDGVVGNKCSFCREFAISTMFEDKTLKQCVPCTHWYRKIIEDNVYTPDNIEELVSQMIGVKDLVILICSYIFY